MWGLIIAFGLVGGLVKVAYGQSVEPTFKPAWRKAKLVRLVKIPLDKLKLDQAEDGAVLAREFGSPIIERKFLTVAERLKRK